MDVCPEFLTLSLSLSFALVADWREQFLADVEYLSRRPNQDEFLFVNDVWPGLMAEVRWGCSFVLIKLPFCV